MKLSYVDQSRDALSPDATVWEEITGGAEIIELGEASMNSRAYCSAFNFKGGDQQKKLGQLSGGERNRVHLAKMLKSGSTQEVDDTLKRLESSSAKFIEDKNTFILQRIKSMPPRKNKTEIQKKADSKALKK